MAKDCLILPSAGADLKVVGALAEVAVTGTQNSGSYPLFQCCKALAEYRQGYFDEPTKWASSAVKYSFPYSKAEGYAILAMSQFGLLRTNEASAALANCDQVIRENFPELSGHNLGGDCCLGAKTRLKYTLWLVESRTAPFGRKEALVTFETNLAGAQVAQAIAPLRQVLASTNESSMQRRFLLISDANNDTPIMIQQGL